MRNGWCNLCGIFRPKTCEKFSFSCVSVFVFFFEFSFSLFCSLSVFSLAFMCQNSCFFKTREKKKPIKTRKKQRISELNSSSHLSLFSLLRLALYYNSPLEERKRERERKRGLPSLLKKASHFPRIKKKKRE